MSAYLNPVVQLKGAGERLPRQVEVSQLQEPVLHKGLALWQAARAGRRFPSREQMSPRALGPLLRHTILTKVLDEGREFQLRIIGDVIVAAQGLPMKGLTTAEIDVLLPGHGQQYHRVFSRVHATGAPLALAGRFRRQADNRVFELEHLVLPLGETDVAVDDLLSVIVYTSIAV